MRNREISYFSPARLSSSGLAGPAPEDGSRAGAVSDVPPCRAAESEGPRAQDVGTSPVRRGPAGKRVPRVVGS